MEVAVGIVMLVIGAIAGFALGYRRKQPQIEEAVRLADLQAQTVLAQAETRAEAGGG